MLGWRSATGIGQAIRLGSARLAAGVQQVSTAWRASSVVPRRGRSWPGGMAIKTHHIKDIRLDTIAVADVRHRGSDPKITSHRLKQGAAVWTRFWTTWITGQQSVRKSVSVPSLTAAATRLKRSPIGRSKPGL